MLILSNYHIPDLFLNLKANDRCRRRSLPHYVLLTFFLLKGINFDLDWKLITIFIGGNDICDHCQNSVSNKMEKQIKTLFLVMKDLV